MDQINETFLNNLPVGSVVKEGYDNWHKQPDGLWTCEFALGASSGTYHGWSALNLVNRYADKLTLVKRGDHEFKVGQKVMHNNSGMEFTVASKDPSGWLRFVGYEHHANTYDPQFFSPVESQDAPAEETETLKAFGLNSFRKGDLVTDVIYTTTGAVDYVEVARTKEPEPEPTKPKPGTSGTALVDGIRTHGLIDEDGDFTYLTYDPYDGLSQGYEIWSDDLEFIADTQED